MNENKQEIEKKETEKLETNKLETNKTEQQKQTKKTKQPNVVFIVVDALSANHLGCYGYNKDISPNIDNMAKQGVLFKNCFVNWVGSEPSFTTIASGMDPQVHGITNAALKITDEEKQILKNVNIKMLAEFLKENDYITIGLAWMGKWHKRGFDFYYDPADRTERAKREKFLSDILAHFPKLKRIASKLYCGAFSFIRRKISGYTDGRSLTNLALDLIEKHKDDKFFIFMHFEDVHTPYICPKDYIIKSEPNDFLVKDMLDRMENKDYREIYETWWGKIKYTSEIIDLYDGCIKKVDDQIKRVIEKTKELDLFDNTIFIITGDHGESMIEHDVYFTHHQLFEESIQIPLIFHYPKHIMTNTINHSLIQQDSITPTILDLLGIKNQDYEFDGISLKPCLINNTDLSKPYILIAEGGHCQKEYGVRTKKFKFIQPDMSVKCDLCLNYHGGKQMLFNLENDPKEQRNLLDKNEKTAQEFKKLIQSTLAKFNHKREKLILRNKIKSIKI